MRHHYRYCRRCSAKIFLVGTLIFVLKYINLTMSHWYFLNLVNFSVFFFKDLVKPVQNLDLKRLKMVLNPKFKIPNALELFKSLKNARSDWKSKTPMQKWCCMYGIARAVYRFLRMPLMNEVDRVHWLAYLMTAYSAIVPMLSLYTICYYAYHGELQMGLPSTCIACILIGVSKILFSF